MIPDMKHPIISRLALICLMLCLISEAFAQKSVGKRNYFASEGAAQLSANTLSHYILTKKSNFFVDLYNELTVPVPTDAVVVKTLVGTNRYKSDKAVFVLENLFVYSIAENGGWSNYLPLAYCVLDDGGKPLRRQYYLISWTTSEFDTAFPAEADILLKEMDLSNNKTTSSTKHTGITYTRTSMTFKLGAEDTVISSVGFFPDKVMTKQCDKSKKMIEKFNSSKHTLDEEVFSDHYMGVRP